MSYTHKIASLIVSLLSLLVSACAGDTPLIPEYADVETPDSDTYVFPTVMQCQRPSFYDELSRASSEWAEGSVIYVAFLYGNKAVLGQSVYREGDWHTRASLSPTDEIHDGTLLAAYVENPVSTASTVSANEYSILYFGEGGFTLKNGELSISVTLKPENWRLRFSGVPGQEFRLPAKGCSIGYNAEFNPSTFVLNRTFSDVTLQVGSDGYTPYIYGVFVNEGHNTVTVQLADGVAYQRSLMDSELTKGMTGLLKLPSADNLYGWQLCAHDVSEFDREDFGDDIDLNARSRKANLLP